MGSIVFDESVQSKGRYKGNVMNTIEQGERTKVSCACFDKSKCWVEWPGDRWAPPAGEREVNALNANSRCGSGSIAVCGVLLLPELEVSIYRSCENEVGPKEGKSIMLA